MVLEKVKEEMIVLIEVTGKISSHLLLILSFLKLKKLWKKIRSRIIVVKMEKCCEEEGGRVGFTLLGLRFGKKT